MEKGVGADPQKLYHGDTQFFKERCLLKMEAWFTHLEYLRSAY